MFAVQDRAALASNAAVFGVVMLHPSEGELHAVDVVDVTKGLQRDLIW